jgi:transposase-like protein
LGGALVRLTWKTKFHECPQCKSKSVWKTGCNGTVEETLQGLLKLSPYRCAQCDKRFLDFRKSNSSLSDRWLARAQSTASRLLRSVQRTPLGELKLNSIVSQNAKSGDVQLQDSV